MSSCLIAGVQLARDGTGNVTSATQADLAMLVTGGVSSFTFTYNGAARTGRLTPVAMTR